MMKKSNQKTVAVLPEDLMAEMLAAIPEKAQVPSARRRAAMKQAMLAGVAAMPLAEAANTPATATAMHIVRADEGNWIRFAPSVDMKILNDDGNTRTWLARFQAGGCIPSHWQTGDEEAIVLEGWCYVGEDIMRQGDYQLIAKGQRHGEIVSPEGCLVFVRSHSAKKTAADLAVVR